LCFHLFCPDVWVPRTIFLSDPTPPPNFPHRDVFEPLVPYAFSPFLLGRIPRRPHRFLHWVGNLMADRRPCCRQPSQLCPLLTWLRFFLGFCPDLPEQSFPTQELLLRWWPLFFSRDARFSAWNAGQCCGAEFPQTPDHLFFFGSDQRFPQATHGPCAFERPKALSFGLLGCVLTAPFIDPQVPFFPLRFRRGTTMVLGWAP